jgi:thiosulfate reductase/polysulfide reductase chain A
MTTSPARSTTEKAIICCACSQQCGVVVHVEDSRIVGISGDKNHPVSWGFICPKGTRAAELHYDHARIDWPLKRVGKKTEGRWQQIGWEQALDEIAAKVRALKRTFSPESIALTFGTIHGSDWGIGERFLNLLGSPNSAGQDKICSGPTTIAEALTYGFGPTGVSPVPGITKCMVLWGRRPSASAPLLWRQIVKARHGGAKLVVVDPLRTLEARQADVWLQLKPGSDAALALGWLNVIFRQELYDRDFVHRHTVGFAELEKRAREYPPERVAELTWIAEQDIVESARIYARSSPALLIAGNGLCQIGVGAVQGSRALACVVAVTGNLNRKGANRVAGPPKAVVANGDMMLADRLPAEQRRKRLGSDYFWLLGQSYNRFDEAMSRIWYGKRNLMNWTASAHEPSLWRAITTQKPYPVRALFVQHHNPIGASANARQVAEALRSPNLELLVVHDLFLTPTAQFADYVLPASHWLEKPFFSVGLASIGCAGDYAEAAEAAIPPEFGHRSDYDLWRDLGQRLGQEQDWPRTAEKFYDQCLCPSGLAFEDLARQSGPWTGIGAPTERESGLPSFGTVSGKVELCSDILGSSGCDPLPSHVEPEIFRRYTRDFPLVLTTGGRLIEGFHQNAQQTSCFRKKFPDPVAQIHPQVAAQLEIIDGEWIRIETPIGNVTQRARITDIVAPRVVQADRWWYPERSGTEPVFYNFWETNINVCTDDDPASCDPVMGSWTLRAVPCRLSKLDQTKVATAPQRVT